MSKINDLAVPQVSQPNRVTPEAALETLALVIKARRCGLEVLAAAAPHTKTHLVWNELQPTLAKADRELCTSIAAVRRQLTGEANAVLRGILKSATVKFVREDAGRPDVIAARQEACRAAVALLAVTPPPDGLAAVYSDNAVTVHHGALAVCNEVDLVAHSYSGPGRYPADVEWCANMQMVLLKTITAVTASFVDWTKGAPRDE